MKKDDGIEPEPRDVLAFVGRLAVQGRAPKDKAELLDLLDAAGFSAAVVERALGAPEERAARDRARRERLAVPIRRLTENATRFLNALQDLGYIDDLMEDELLDAAMAEWDGDIDLPRLRPHVAAVLFDRQYDLAPETLRFLEEEWRLVFH
jgi:hypothetical protein